MAGVGVKRPRIVLQLSYEEFIRWEELAQRWKKRTVPQMIKFTMNMAVRYYRELYREREAAFARETLDRLGRRAHQREQVSEALKAAREALARLDEVMR